MAGTNFSEINDIFMTLIEDYRLITLYQSSEENFNTYLESWLILSIVDFEDICTQSLVYTSAVPPAITSSFTETLTNENKTILARLMVKYWLQKEVQDILQMRLKIQDRDFRTFSEAQNFGVKSQHLDKVKEECSQAIVSYGFKHLDWDSWKQGTF